MCERMRKPIYIHVCVIVFTCSKDACAYLRMHACADVPVMYLCVLLSMNTHNIASLNIEDVYKL